MQKHGGSHLHSWDAQKDPKVDLWKAFMEPSKTWGKFQISKLSIPYSNCPRTPERMPGPLSHWETLTPSRNPVGQWLQQVYKLRHKSCSPSKAVRSVPSSRLDILPLKGMPTECGIKTNIYRFLINVSSYQKVSGSQDLFPTSWLKWSMFTALQSEITWHSSAVANSVIGRQYSLTAVSYKAHEWRLKVASVHGHRS